MSLENFGGEHKRDGMANHEETSGSPLPGAQKQKRRAQGLPSWQVYWRQWFSSRTLALCVARPNHVAAGHGGRARCEDSGHVAGDPQGRTQ